MTKTRLIYWLTAVVHCNINQTEQLPPQLIERMNVYAMQNATSKRILEWYRINDTIEKKVQALAFYAIV